MDSPAVGVENRRARERSLGSPSPAASTPVPGGDLRLPGMLSGPGLTEEYESELVLENSHARESAGDLLRCEPREISWLVPGWGWAAFALPDVP